MIVCVEGAKHVLFCEMVAEKSRTERADALVDATKYGTREGRTFLEFHFET